MESLDRPYGDDEEDYAVVDPEAHAEVAEERDMELPTVDGDPHHGDPAFAPVEEAGGGVSEGFEVAEGQLIDNVEGAPDADRTLDGFDPDDPGTDVDEDVEDDVRKFLDDHERSDVPAIPRDEEARRATAEYGEPDHVDVTEVVNDPAEGD
jgi:hypothetical protein